MRARELTTLVTAILLGGPAAVHAQFGATAEVERPMPAGSDEDPTAAATVVEVDGDRPRALGTTAEAMAEVPATRTRQTGDMGSFAGLSIRGADLDHTTVLFGDLPLGPAAGGAFDLSTIPLTLLERIEVYRGGAPLLVGGRGIGGVVRLVPREAEGTHAEGTVGVGSFGRWEGRAAASTVGRDGRPAVTTLAGWRHTDGDYPYDLDPDDSINPGEDTLERRRQNGEIDEGYGLLHARLRALGGELQVLGLAFGRTGGLTGSPVEEPTRTHRQLTRAVGTVAWQRRWLTGAHPARLRVSLGAAHERNRLTDRYGEIARVPRVTDDDTARLFARMDGDVQLAEWVTVAALLTHSVDRFAPEDRSPFRSMTTDETSLRNTTTVGAEGRFHGRLGDVRSELRASTELQVADVRLVEIRRDREGEHIDRTLVAPTFRLGLAVEPIGGLAVTGSVASATRLPTVLELFGDRAFVLGDTRLDPERAVQLDAGAVLQGELGELEGTVETRFFAVLARDLIQFVRTAQRQVTPTNVGRATITGVETGVRGRWGRHLGLIGSVTWLHTRNHAEQGRELPLRPSLQAYVRPEVSFGTDGWLSRVTVYADATHVAANFVDPRNVTAMPARTLVGAGVAFEVLDGRLRLVTSVRDVFDRRPFDLVGFPLPGRTFAAELTVRTREVP